MDKRVKKLKKALSQVVIPYGPGCERKCLRGQGLCYLLIGKCHKNLLQAKFHYSS